MENKKIFNLTQHVATAEQIAAGVVEPSPADKTIICQLLTFDEIPTLAEMRKRANSLGKMVPYHEFRLAMIGGAPFFMSTLERELDFRDIKAVYAFSKRQSIDETIDGKVVKRSVFVHAGFVPAIYSI